MNIFVTGLLARNASSAFCFVPLCRLYNKDVFVRSFLLGKNCFPNSKRLFQKTTTNLKNVLWSRLRHKSSNTDISKFIRSSIPCVSLGIIGSGLLHSRRHRFALCESRPDIDNTRLVGATNHRTHSDPDFDWVGFWRILLPDILYVLAAIASAIAAAFVNIKIPLLLGELINVVSKFTTDTAASFMNDIQGPSIKLFGMYCIQGLLTYVYIALLSIVGENVAARMKKELFGSIISQDIQFFDKHKTGELVDRLTTDVQDFKSAFKMCISQGLRSFTQTIGCIVSLFVISPKLTAIIVLVIPAIVAIGSKLGASLRILSRKAQDQVSQSTSVADEAIGNVRTVRAFAMESKEYELFSQQVDMACDFNKELGQGIGMYQGLANAALNGIVLGTIFAGGWMISLHELTAGNLMAFLVATQTVERSLERMSLLFGQVIKGLSAGARVFEFINISPDIPLTGGKKISFHCLMGHVEFEGVHFSYPTRSEQEVLQDFNLKIQGGSVVALVGTSGGGKSTIAALLERFYDVDKGKITLDGVDIKRIDPTWLRGRAIGFINQEPVLFATSVMENIRYGKPNATDTEVIEAAKLANAHDFISQFPCGYNTVLGERGVTVSGGQKQRIAIARALIKNPSILILDEATSALDAESERIVQDALDKVTKGRTVLVIAHRLSTIRDADVIAVISDGKVVELGTHSCLKDLRGLYWELIRKQELEDEISHHKY